MADRHLIGKQVIELEVNSSKDAYAIQQKISELVHKKIMPACNALFDELIPQDKVVRLDIVEIDIGVIQLIGNYEEKIVQRIIELLEEKIKKQLEYTGYQKDLSPSKDKDEIRKLDRLLRNKADKKRRLDIDNKYSRNEQISKEDYITMSNSKFAKDKYQSLRRYYFELWIHWLEKGNLPSYAMAPKENWIPFVLETLGLDIDAVTILENTLKKKPVALQRLVIQHINKDLKSIVELYTGFSQTRLLMLFEEIMKIYENVSHEFLPATYRTLEINIWKHIFSLVTLNRKKLDSKAIGLEIVRLPIMKSFFGIAEVKEVLEIEKKRQQETDSFLMELFQKSDFGGIQEESEVSLLHDEEIIEEGKDNQTENDSLLIYDEEPLETPQFFANAGIVVLHPFLSSFFKKLNLIKNQDFVDFAAQSKAVILLHFLASAEEIPKEYEMVLPKFLCNMPVNIPLDHTIMITDKDKEEANTLLEAVIEHWGVLGKSSPDGLREGFLMREGKLEKQQTGWRLVVEQKTMDILLDRLPWNLSLIKLPWMDDILNVEWR